jgi:hypothetical protein
MSNASPGNSESSKAKDKGRQGQKTKIELLSNLLQKEKETEGVGKLGQGVKTEILDKTVEYQMQHNGLEISKNPEMNLFKLSPGSNYNTSNSLNGGSVLGNSGSTKMEQSRHINFNKNEYLSKLFNDIKKSQLVKSEKQLNSNKDEVFNDTFGHGGTNREYKIENKENEKIELFQKTIPKNQQINKNKNILVPKSENKNVFKEQEEKKEEKELKKKVVPLLRKVTSKQKLNVKPNIEKLDMGKKKIFKPLNTSKRNVSSLEKRSKRSLSKKPFKKKKLNNIHLMDSKRNKTTR